MSARKVLSEQTTPPPVGEQARVEAAGARAGTAQQPNLIARLGAVRNLGLVGVVAVLGIIGGITAETFWT